jgi:YfdX protein
MKTANSILKNSHRDAAILLAMSLSIMAFATEAAMTATTANTVKQTNVNNKDSKDNSGVVTHKQIIKEAADAFKATQTALNALENNQPDQALAALEVVSGNLHLLLARDPALGLVPIDIQTQVIVGVTDLKAIKKLEDELEDLINDKQYQAARPIVDSLVDEIRVTTIYLPLATYPATIDRIAPLIDAGKIEAAKQLLIDLLNTYVSEQEVTPLAIIRAEEKLTEAFQIEHKSDLSKQESKNKIEKLVKDAEQDIKVAEALGYGSEDDYEDLYDGIKALKEAIGTSGFKGEWAKIKKSMSSFKNKIVHPRG